MRGSCALPQDSMSLLGHIFDLHARHGAIMALEAPVRKRAVIGISEGWARGTCSLAASTTSALVAADPAGMTDLFSAKASNSQDAEASGASVNAPHE